MHYIQAMEEEKFSLLPRGPVAEELLRIYAAYVGIDANQALDEYRRLHFSTPVEPPPALGGTVMAWPPPRWAISAVAAVLALAVGCGGIWFYDPTVRLHWPGVPGCWRLPSTATPIPTPTALPTTTPTVTLTPSATPTATPRRPRRLSPTPTPEPTATIAPTPTRRR